MDQEPLRLDRRALLVGAAASLSHLAAPGARASESARVLDTRILEARAGWLELVPGKPTAFEGFDGRSPGTLLRLRKGDPLDVTLVNSLLRPTSIHWRGVRGPNEFDGVAPLTQKPVEPGARQQIRFTPPDAGTYLYHAHAEPDMAAQVERGLYGALIVEEPDAPPVDHDLLAMLDDWRLDEAGAVSACGPIDVLTVNSAPAPMTQQAAPRARVRLRLVNAASARIMAVRFEEAQAMVVAIDGQPCRAFPPLRDTLPIGPGARFDVILDLPAQEGESARAVLLGANGAPDRPLVVLTARGAPVEPRPPVEAAAQNPLLPAEIRLQAAHRLDLGLEGPAGETPGPASPGLPCPTPAGGWRLATPKPVRAGAPLFAVKRGTPVALGFVNRTGVAQVMRVHGHAMRQLHQLDDGWEPYWRDSVIVGPGRTVRVAFVADNPGRWRIGSGVMTHAAGGMAGFFEVG
jgi:FtsP/CotA-like multicopper oxidase with cupredoxin domain